MRTCKDCDKAQLMDDIEYHRKIYYCEASLNELGESTYRNVPDDCPLLSLEKTYAKGDSRAQKCIADRPLESLVFFENRPYPAKINFLDQVKLKCVKAEGYIKECDSESWEDCFDCWNKEFTENDL